MQSIKELKQQIKDAKQKAADLEKTNKVEYPICKNKKGELIMVTNNKKPINTGISELKRKLANLLRG